MYITYDVETCRVTKEPCRDEKVISMRSKGYVLQILDCGDCFMFEAWERNGNLIESRIYDKAKMKAKQKKMLHAKPGAIYKRMKTK